MNSDRAKLLAAAIAAAVQLGFLVATRWLMEISTPAKDWRWVRNQLAWLEDALHDWGRWIWSRYDPRLRWLRKQFG